MSKSIEIPTMKEIKEFVNGEIDKRMNFFYQQLNGIRLRIVDIEKTMENGKRI